MRMHNRRKVRLGLRVIHRHRVGRLEFRRVSELVFVRGRPKAILGWIDVGGMRSPIFMCDLDPGRLRKAGAGNSAKNTYYYDSVTVDPRYEELGPVEEDSSSQDDSPTRRSSRSPLAPCSSAPARRSPWKRAHSPAASRCYACASRATAATK